ncbi:response regulator [bacterium]|nr:response regulator [bacterium]
MNRKILIVDDNKAIHKDFEKILCCQIDEELDDLESLLFDVEKPSAKEVINFELDSAFQGQNAYQMAREAASHKAPYAMAFVDMRMPPGLNGIETIKKIWQYDPNLEVVICTAYSDYTWDEIVNELGHEDKLVFLSKPFSGDTIRQLASTLVEKWNCENETKLA